MNEYYGQNNPPEDSAIAKFFGDVPNGRYIDIGSGEPSKHSNTRYFYNQGWRGIAIEPHPHYAPMWKEERPEDIYIQAAITDHDGETEMCSTATVGSFIGDDYKFNLKKELFMVPCMTLETLMKKYPEFSSCEFVSIDTETNEENIFSTYKYELLHPRLFVIEVEMRYVDYSHKWEHKLLPYYRRVSQIQNNAFYLRNE